MENISIKDYIVNNFKDDDEKAIKKAINESINEQDEVVLPGLGVFLSLIWQGSNEDIKKSMITILHQELHNNK